jgi:hypothetical protein
MSFNNEHYKMKSTSPNAFTTMNVQQKYISANRSRKIIQHTVGLIQPQQDKKISKNRLEARTVSTIQTMFALPWA